MNTKLNRMNKQVITTSSLAAFVLITLLALSALKLILALSTHTGDPMACATLIVLCLTGLMQRSTIVSQARTIHALSSKW